MINDEQIQALKAAAEKAKLSQRRGGMEMVADSYDFIAMTTPQFILSLLAERDADKALIAEQDARLIEYARIATENAARTLTVKFPEAATVGGQGYRKKAIWVLQEACFDAGITLVVGE